jgi:hypothetical protein
MINKKMLLSMINNLRWIRVLQICRRRLWIRIPLDGSQKTITQGSAAAVLQLYSFD